MFRYSKHKNKLRSKDNNLRSSLSAFFGMTFRPFFCKERAKGQADIELVFLIGLLFMAFSFSYLAFVDKSKEVVDTKLAQEGRNLADSVEFEISNAFRQGSGFSRNFTLPNTLLGNGYTIQINESILIIESGAQSYVSILPTHNITGTITPGKNTIKNSGGIINVTQP